MHGVVININPTIFTLGSFEFRWYSLAVLAAAATVFFLALKGAKKNSLPPDTITGLAPWVMVGGILGARLFHILDHLSYYLAYPGQMLQFNQGGLAIWGALVGGGAIAVLYAIVKRIPLGLLGDILVPGLLAGQIIGRLGCIINGDAAGGPTGLPWGFIYTNPGASISPSLLGVATHPYPVYEMLWNGVILLAALILRKRVKQQGTLFAIYLSAYALGRLLLTAVRSEPVLFWGLQEAQVFALAAWVLAAIIALRLKLRTPHAEGATR